MWRMLEQKLGVSCCLLSNEMLFYCIFHKHANTKLQKPPSQLRFSLPSIIITIRSNESWHRETHNTDRNPPIRNHNPWPFEPVKIKFCFLRGPLRWLTAAKNAIVSWLLNFRIRMFVKSAVTPISDLSSKFYDKKYLVPQHWEAILAQSVIWKYSFHLQVFTRCCPTTSSWYNKRSKNHTVCKDMK